MKKLLIIACATLLLGGCCAQQKDDQCEISNENYSTIGLANPFYEYDTLEEAFTGAGLSINLPNQIDDYQISIYRAIPDKLLEIIYVNNEAMLRVRKSMGASDNSGNYTAEIYEEALLEHDDLKINIETKEDLIYVAHWVKDCESYSVTCDTGITSETLKSLIDIINK